MNSEDHLNRLEEYLFSRCEHAALDFKSEFDPFSNQDWCEILKDLIAFANSGGGLILIGLNDEGLSANCDVDKILTFDPAEVSKKIEKYTGSSYSDFRISEVKSGDARLACIAIGAAHIPIVFSKPGTYAVAGTSQQKTAFGQGTLYFRHGAKSEHANQEDLRIFLDREVDRIRQTWLANVRKVIEAPLGARVVISTDNFGDLGRVEKAVRLTSDKAASEVIGLDSNYTHPHRQKEVLRLVNGRISGACITSHDLLAVRKYHGLESRADLCFKPKYSSAQYSDACVEWIADQYANDPHFFESAKIAFKTTHTCADPQDERLNWAREYMQRKGLSISGMAQNLKISMSTFSRLLSATYKGDVAKMVERISVYREKSGD